MFVSVAIGFERELRIKYGTAFRCATAASCREKKMKCMSDGAIRPPRRRRQWRQWMDGDPHSLVQQYFSGFTAWYIVHVFDFNFHFGREKMQRKWIASAASSPRISYAILHSQFIHHLKPFRSGFVGCDAPAFSPNHMPNARLETTSWLGRSLACNRRF